jgi:CRISPR-associated exonuclease Cas4
MYCPRKLFISHVLLVEEAPKIELVKGKIWHETHELMNKSEEGIVSGIKTGDYQDLFDIYRKNYSRFLRNAILRNKSGLKKFNAKMLDIFTDYWPSFEEEAKERALNLSKFIAKHKVYGAELWKRLTPKLLSEQYFRSERLNLSGVIDVIEIHDNTVYVPVELKTGKVPDRGMWDGHRIQLAAYMLLLEDAGKDVKEAILKYRGAEGRVLPLNTFLKDEVMDLIKKTARIISGFDPPKHVDNKNKCKSCQFKEVCYDAEKFRVLVSEAKTRSKAPS